jgi:hypothetical protein
MIGVASPFAYVCWPVLTARWQVATTVTLLYTVAI